MGRLQQNDHGLLVGGGRAARVLIDDYFAFGLSRERATRHDKRRTATVHQNQFQTHSDKDST